MMIRALGWGSHDNSNEARGIEKRTERSISCDGFIVFIISFSITEPWIISVPIQVHSRYLRLEQV